MGHPGLVVCRVARHAEDMRAIIACVCLVIVLAACGDASEPLVFTDLDTGAQIPVGTGDRFELRLESNPSTGYGWTLAEGMPDCLEMVREISFIGCLPGVCSFLFRHMIDGLGSSVSRRQMISKGP